MEMTLAVVFLARCAAAHHVLQKGRRVSWSGILCMRITILTSGVLALLGLHPGHIHHSTGERRAGVAGTAPSAS